jgi:predicted GNAT superfamily acetyltransferase
MNQPPSPILIRPCSGFEELDACVQMQADVWGYRDRDLAPRRVLIVAQKIGGQVMGAFDTALPGTSPQGEPDSLVGFAMAFPGISRGRPYLHSYMLAVNPDYRNQGIGRRLKLFQRDEALARGNGPSTRWKSRTLSSILPGWGRLFVATHPISMV